MLEWLKKKTKTKIEKLSLCGDDIIVIHLDWDVSPEERDYIRQSFRDLNIGNPILVLGKGQQLSVLERTE